MEEIVDLEKMRWTPSRIKRENPEVNDRRYLRGPIPMSWIAKANKASSKSQAVSVGMVVWHLVFINRSIRVRVENIRMREMGISRYSLRRGLIILEKEKLVEVDRRRGRSPIVTLTGLPDWWDLETTMTVSKKARGVARGK